MSSKYILITGGVISGLGKGIIASSIGRILIDLGFSVTSIKIDPYLNIDCGTMSPYEHGEVFVLKDGTEVDLDLGNYERFIGNDLCFDNNITTGKIYQSVITKERRGDYLGQTVQIIPHVTNEIISWIQNLVKKDESDLCIIELGGTIGDIEGMPFIEALRQLMLRVGLENFCVIHLSLVPSIGKNNEQKTKPTQQSVRELKSLGINPDIIVCRSKEPITNKVKEKISLFCFSNKNLRDNVISSYDVDDVLEVPLILLNQRLDEILLKRFGFDDFQMKVKKRKKQLKSWKNMINRKANLLKQKKLPIGIVGKYTKNEECYFSVVKAIQHASLECNVNVEIVWIESEELLENGSKEYEKSWGDLKRICGMIIPGGFGVRGIEGKIMAAQYARENNIPFLGICLGFQCGCVEFARNILNLKDANSEEFDKNTKNPVIIFMPEITKDKKGGTMRLGEKKTFLNNKMGGKVNELYKGAEVVKERHRHRYEVNYKKYRKIFEENKFFFVGIDETGKRLEIFELFGHPYYVGTQFHPEFNSKFEIIFSNN